MKSNSHLFHNRPLLIVTKHDKNKVMAPILKKELGVHCLVSKQFDTDSLGTFSGEFERKKDAFQTLRDKCRLAMELEGYDLALATEGSFGNHPTVFFAPANDELILLMDKKNKLEIVERVLSLETNFKSEKLDSEEALHEFLTQVKFPSHGVIIKNKEKNWTFIKKGLQSRKEVFAVFNALKQENESVWIETDMRAHMNPTRMQIIKESCEKLVKKIQSTCPHCHFPGFGVTQVEAGLKCESCRMPTRSTAAHIYQCQQCGFEEKVAFPNGKTTEDPMYCDFCNP